ncbi:hypothetical protein AB0J38_41200 [Streptomyces sp. NPDC050095]|uniref:hypothetical protein n=1 Tax=unclassified Streptomyces TaxID=2593676 RepID=UPI0034247267
MEREVALLAGEMIKNAPRGPHVMTDAFSIKKNITPYVERIDREWVGFVVIEENERARHAMLQEEGYRDRAGRRHAGRFYLKKALEKGRLT